MEPVKYKSFKWNEHGVCTNAKLVAAYDVRSYYYYHVFAAECETGWSVSVDYSIGFTGGGYCPRYGGELTEKECVVAGLKEMVRRIKHDIDCTYAKIDKEKARAMLRRVNEQLAECMQYELF